MSTYMIMRIQTYTLPDSTRHPLNVQTWFQSDLNVYGLSTNVLKTYVIQCTKYVYI